MFKFKRKYILLAALAIVGIAAFIWTRSYVFSGMGISLHQKIQSLDLSGFNIRYDSISVDWIGNVVEIDNLILEKNAYDTTCIYPEFISVGKVHAEGIGLFRLIFRNELSIRSVRLEKLRVLVRENSLLQLDSAAKKKNNEFGLDVDNVFISSAEFTYLDSARCELLTGLKSDISIRGLVMDFRVDKPFKYEAVSVTLDSLQADLPQHFYSVNVLKAEMNFASSSLRIDTVRIIPQLGKREFGRKHGYEIDRFEATIPYFRVANLSFSLADTSLIKAGTAQTQFYLKVFRDKRLPFVKKQKLLPVAMIRDLPFNLLIDSLKIENSYVEYEEVAEGMSEAGKVFFDNLYAVLVDIDNRATEGEIQLSAHAKLLGQGDLSLFAAFPLQENKRSRLEGSIKDFNLPELNSMLTPSTQMKVESGKMKVMSFGFTYNAMKSDGLIELNYEDLKVVSFKAEEKQNGKEPEKDNLKTFIMNTFIFKKNMDEDVPQEKRQGTVLYMRDDSRSIFNFWVKSLVSGVKSAYNLDKVEARQEEKETKQEQREARREARRAKKSEKKRERG